MNAEGYIKDQKTGVFISYYNEEHEIALQIKRAIGKGLYNKEDTAKVFKGEESLFAGSEWFNEIRDKLYDCQVFVVVCSPGSVKRKWVAFECGVARQGGTPMLAFCHSGMTPGELPGFIKNSVKDDCIFSITEENALNHLVHKVKSLINKSDNVSIDNNAVNSKLNALVTVGENPDLSKLYNSKEELYLWCSLKRDGDEIKIDIDENRQIEKRKHPLAHEKANRAKQKQYESDRLERLAEMHRFVTGRSDSVETGIAIGIQNCLYDHKAKDLFVGVRYKSKIDATNSRTSLSRGGFNTGYLLLRSHKNDRERVRSMESLQDLFVSRKAKHFIKPFIDTDQGTLDVKRDKISGQVYEHVDSQLKIFGSQLFKIQLLKNSAGNREYGYGSLLINNSCWFPRFEIGIWKYMDISQLTEKEKEPIKTDNSEGYTEHYVKGFGEDLFQDYRGNVRIEDVASQINFWVWVKDGEIRYRSYPEERFIPRKKPQRRTQPLAHSILISSDQLEREYGIGDRNTQFVPDENLNSIGQNASDSRDRIIQTQPGQPAMRLLTWF